MDRPVALITGCSDPTSLGAALSINLARKGWRVYASGLDLESMVDIAIKGCETLVLDVTNQQHIQAAKKTIGSRRDLLINNAASEGLGPLLDTDHEKLEELYRINVFAPLALIQASQDELISLEGCIAALQIISDVLRRELAPLKVSVLTVELGMVMTATLRAEDPFELNLPPHQRAPAFEKWYTDLLPQYRADITKRSKTAMSASQAAEQIINRVEGGRGGKIWVGTMAWIFRWVWPFLSTWQQDKINSDLLKVHLLSKR